MITVRLKVCLTSICDKGVIQFRSLFFILGGRFTDHRDFRRFYHVVYETTVNPYFPFEAVGNEN